MMRNLFYLLFLTATVLYGQDVKNYSARQVGKMAVFPGCEEFEKEGKDSLQRCFSQKIGQLLGEKLDDFSDNMKERGVTESVTKVQFISDRNGKMVQVSSVDSPENDAVLAVEAVKAMEEIANEIQLIKPAELNDGTKVNMVIQLPVRIRLEDDTPNYIEKGVVVTMKGENENYEVVFDAPNKIYTIYAVKDEVRSYLGVFNSMNEILLLQPYTSLNPYLDEKILITEGRLDDKKYRVWLNRTYGDIVEIYDITSGEQSLVTTMPMNDLYLDEYYSKLIRR